MTAFSLSGPARLLRASALLAIALAAGWIFADEPGATSRKANRLLGEKSPYLQQHAYNPVDWYPWGEAAFAAARTQNKPIFLSIGYATCHWCHVMERESFSNPEIARLLNENFVCIKVDREERPDVDRVYMTFVQASTGGGGWPMSVWLTPQLKPFFGGTYFAPESKPGRPGFKAVLSRLAERWGTQREKILQQSDRMLAALAADTRAVVGATGELPIADLRKRALSVAAETFDQRHGGFEQAPKFPQEVMLDFLLDVQATTKDATQREQASRMALKTLREMAAGGIHDQLGGGFHRYSVDAKWHVPHFEKMLYDQAQLASAYLAGWQLSGDPSLKEAAEDTLRYVREQMTDPAGGFYSAEDADSATGSGTGGAVRQAHDPAPTEGPPSDPEHGRDAQATTEHAEGAFYVWRAEEIEALLGREPAAVFAFVYGVEPDGNAATDPEGEFRRQNILYRAHTTAEAAAKFQKSETEVRELLAAARTRLLEARAKRSRPLRDDKIITAWNGLTISAFARAAQVLSDRSYADVATRAAEFAEASLFDAKTGRLSRSWRAGVRDERGFAEDYAFLVQGLLDLYETTFELRWLERAVQLQEKQNELFWDAQAGGYFANTADDPSVLLRLKGDNDGAEPSANSIAVRNLARLAEMLHRESWREQAVRTAQAFATQLERAPTAMPQMLAAIGWLEGSPKQVLVVGASDSEKATRLFAEVWRRFLPRRVLVRIDERSRPYFDAQVPFVAGVPDETGGNATVYVCENFVCQMPTSDPAELVKLLER